jgi:hypothetical protein
MERKTTVATICGNCGQTVARHWQPLTCRCGSDFADGAPCALVTSEINVGDGIGVTIDVEFLGEWRADVRERIEREIRRKRDDPVAPQREAWTPKILQGGKL